MKIHAFYWGVRVVLFLVQVWLAYFTILRLVWSNDHLADTRTWRYWFYILNVPFLLNSIAFFVKFMWEILRAINECLNPIPNADAIAAWQAGDKSGNKPKRKDLDEWISRKRSGERLAALSDITIAVGLTLSLLFWFQLVMELLFAHEGAYPHYYVFMQAGFHFGVFAIHLTFYMLDMHAASTS